MKSLTSTNIKFGLMTIPIQIYSVRDKSDSIGFSSLSECCKTTTKLKRSCGGCGKELAWRTGVKGFKIGKNEYVPLTAKEIESIDKASNGIEIIDFVTDNSINSNMLGMPYFIDSEDRVDLHSALIEVLTQKKMIAVCKFVLKQTEHIAVLKSFESNLYIQMLEKTKEFANTERVKASDDIKTLLGQLVDKNTKKKFSFANYPIEYNDKLKEMIKLKANGKDIVTTLEVKEKVKEKDTEQMLKAMLKEV